MSMITVLGRRLLVLMLRSGADFEWTRGETPLSSWQWPVGGLVAYLAVVAILRAAVKQPIHVPRTVSAAHNLVLCLGSLVMFVGCASAALEERQRRHSWDFFFCAPPGMRPAGRLFFWSYAYYLSKFYEFLDTVLLLVKAKPASFLHVFHHAVVVVMAWLWVDQAQTLQWGGLLTNTAVHVVMYWYYYETTLGNSPWWKKYITSFQIAQFSASFMMLIPFAMYQLQWRRDEGGCGGLAALAFNAAFNLCLLLLFVQFYKGTYKKRKRS